MSFCRTLTFSSLCFLFLTAEQAFPVPVSPDELAVCITTGDSLLQRGEYDAARDAYKAAKKLNRESYGALRGLTEVAIEQRDWGDLKDRGGELAKLDYIEGFYYQGIGYRETGKFKGPLLRKIDFDKAKDRLQKVIDRDSTFRDVFIQRALVERYRDDYPEAIRWARRQLSVKPGLVSAQVALYKLYDAFIHFGYEPKVRPWLQSDTTVLGRYFKSDWLRREGKLSLADSGFAALSENPDPALEQMLLLSRIRLELQRDNETAAAELFSMVIDSMSSEIAAAFAFENCKYILTDDEVRRYRLLDTIEQKREFFQLAWRSRNPTPASPANPRALEHFRRMIYAEKYYWDNYVRSPAMRPTQSLGLRYPDAYFLNDSFNDRGLIFLRQGEPDDKISSQSFGVDTNESWLYREREDRPELVFHFLGLHWQLAPYVDNAKMLDDRVGWHRSTTRLARSHSELDFMSNLREVQDEGRDDILAALSTDFHSWGPEVKPIETPNYRAIFRNPDGKARVELFAGVSLAELDSELSEFEQGAYVSDTLYQQVGRRFSQVKELPQDQIFHEEYLQRYSFDLAPGSYYMGFYLRRPQPDAIGGENFELTITQPETSMLDLSDLVLAYEISESDRYPTFAMGDVSVIPNPEKRFEISEGVQLYYEVYNLTTDQNGRTSFEVSHTLSKKGGKKLFGLFGGGDKNRISISEDHDGNSSFSHEHIGFDVSRLDAGEYGLEVIIRDNLADREAKKSIDLRLED